MKKIGEEMISQCIPIYIKDGRKRTDKIGKGVESKVTRRQVRRIS